MYQISDLFKMYLKNPNREFDTKVTISSKDYTGDSIVSFEIENSIVPADEFSIGTVIPSKLILQIKTTDTIASNEKVIPFIKMQGGLVWNYITMSWQQVEVPWNDDSTEIIPLGEFYVDSRSFNNGIWTFTAYDKLILTEQAYNSNLTYPASMINVLNEISTQLGFVKDISIIVNPEYLIQNKPDGLTIREVLGYIAACNGSSVRINKDGRLAFVKFNELAQSIDPTDYFNFKKTNSIKTINKIKVTYNNDGQYLEAGVGDDNSTLKLYNPFITEVILANLYSQYNGFSYQPFEMDSKGYPHLDAGDRIDITLLDGSSVNVPVFVNKLVFNGGLKSVTYSSSVSEQKSEFQFKGTIKQSVETLNKTTIKESKPYNGVTIDKENGVVVEKSDNSVRVIMNATEGFKIEGSSGPLFYIDTSGNIKLATGSITWGEIGQKPTAEQLGAKPYDWLPSYGEILGAKPPTDADNTAGYVGQKLTYIDAFGIYTGTLTAQQINAIQGINLGAGATINWAVVNKPSYEWMEISNKPIDLVYQAALSNYVSNNSLTTMLGFDFLQTGLVAANRIVGGEILGVTIKTSSELNNYISLQNQYLEIFNGTQKKIHLGYDYFMGSFVSSLELSESSIQGRATSLDFNPGGANRLSLNSNSPSVLTGDLRVTGDLEVYGDVTFPASGYTVVGKFA